MKPYVTKHLNDEEDKLGLFKDFRTFKKELKKIFGVYNDKEVIVRVI